MNSGGNCRAVRRLLDWTGGQAGFYYRAGGNAVRRTLVCKEGPSGAELVMLDLDGDSLDIATNDEPADFQLQGTKTIQQKRPVDRQLDQTTNL
ncbi:MAG TPA: hypothetical protein VGP62_26145 [Bryobacteraceae bacterium]|nr:hypothetical protein [Bryobacteraceae bacterium]